MEKRISLGSKYRIQLISLINNSVGYFEKHNPRRELHLVKYNLLLVCYIVIYRNIYVIYNVLHTSIPEEEQLVRGFQRMLNLRR